MKRNWDLIRKILLRAESLGDTQSHIDPDDVDGSDSENVSYHLHLLIEAGLLEGECVQGIDGPLRCYATSLTWEGHEFLDKIRSSGMWDKIKTVARKKGLSLSFDVIKAAATYAIASVLKG